MFINIIIPCYNAERYITKLLVSLLTQTCQDFHITIVDDMSTDNSVNEITAVIKQFSTDKITLIQNTVKTYQGKARNIGFNSCKHTAQYIWFIDADDYLINNTVIEALKTKAVETNADIITFQHLIDLNNTLYTTPLYKQVDAYNLGNLMLNCTVSPWSKIIKTECCIQFNEYITWGEDAIWTLELFDKFNNIVELTDKLYCYRVDQTNSVTTSAKKFINKEHQFTIALEKLLPQVKNIKTKVNILNKLNYQYKRYGIDKNG